MLLLLVLGLPAAALIIVGCANDNELPIIGGGIIGLFFIAALLLLPLNRMSNREWIAGYYATQKTLNSARARQGQSEIERATVLQTVIEMNGKIAAAKYDNSTLWWDWYIVDELTTLPPLQ